MELPCKPFRRHCQTYTWCSKSLALWILINLFSFPLVNQFYFFLLRCMKLLSFQNKRAELYAGIWALEHLHRNSWDLGVYLGGCLLCSTLGHTSGVIWSLLHLIYNQGNLLAVSCGDWRDRQCGCCWRSAASHLGRSTQGTGTYAALRCHNTMA